MEAVLAAIEYCKGECEVPNRRDANFGCYGFFVQYNDQDGGVCGFYREPIVEGTIYGTPVQHHGVDRGAICGPPEWMTAIFGSWAPTPAPTPAPSAVTGDYVVKLPFDLTSPGTMRVPCPAGMKGSIVLLCTDGYLQVATETCEPMPRDICDAVGAVCGDPAACVDSLPAARCESVARRGRCDMPQFATACCSTCGSDGT